MGRVQAQTTMSSFVCFVIMGKFSLRDCSRMH